MDYLIISGDGETLKYFTHLYFSSGIMLAKIDAKGRLYIPKKLRKKLGSEVYLVEMEEKIIVIPKPDDPLKELEEIGKSLPDKSIEELRKEILKQAMEEIE